MTDEQIAETVSQKLDGTLKKYTHTVRLKGMDRPIVFNVDEELRICVTEGISECVLKAGYSDRPPFCCRMSEVLFWHTVNHQP